MSFDLYFWRYGDPSGKDHAAVCRALAKGEAVDGLELLDTAAMVETLGGLLSDWERAGSDTRERKTTAGGYLTAEPGERHLILLMSFNVSRAVILKISTPMRKFGAGLWNPQTGQRINGDGEGAA